MQAMASLHGDVVAEPEMSGRQYSVAFLAICGVLLWAFVAAAFNIPRNIHIGWEGQAAIKMLDELRRPFFAMKAVQVRIFGAVEPSGPEEMNSAVRAGRALLAQYLELAQYNPALEREVRGLSATFEEWVSAQDNLARQWAKIGRVSSAAGVESNNEVGYSVLKHLSLMSETDALFLKTMSRLGDGEHAIHADIESGRVASLVLLVLSVVLAAYLAGAVLLDYRVGVRAKKEASDKESRLLRLALFDTLTGLPNSTLFNDRLATAMAAARRDGTRAAVLFIDLDGFKHVNDLLGHAAGDGVLKETAKRLSSCVREADTVARLGGDEFVILLRNITELADSVEVAKKIIDSLSRPFGWGETATRIGASVGIAHYPDDGQCENDLLEAADTAMYEVKKNRKGSYQVASELAPALDGVALRA